MATDLYGELDLKVTVRGVDTGGERDELTNPASVSWTVRQIDLPFFIDRPGAVPVPFARPAAVFAEDHPVEKFVWAAVGENSGLDHALVILNRDREELPHMHDLGFIDLDERHGAKLYARQTELARGAGASGGSLEVGLDPVGVQGELYGGEVGVAVLVKDLGVAFLED